MLYEMLLVPIIFSSGENMLWRVYNFDSFCHLSLYSLKSWSCCFMHTFLLIFCGFCTWPRQDLTSDAIEHFLWPLLKRTALFSFVASKQTFNRGSRFLHRGYQGISSFIPHHKRLLNREQHSFPKLSQSHCTFQIVETWPWPLGYPIITRSAWNTGKALWPPLNVRLTIAKVIFGQILEYSLHCITFNSGNSRVTLRFCLV